MGSAQDIADELRRLNGCGSGNNFYTGQKLTPSITHYNTLKASVARDIHTLKRKLAAHWQNTSRSRSITNEHDGRFSVNDAIRCSISNENNYLVKKTKRTNHKPAVCVLADLSGSMNGFDSSKIKLCTQQAKALVALSEACDLIGIPLNIMGFSDRVITLKGWNTPMAQARGMLGSADRAISGTNIDTAFFEGIKALKGRKESRKILVTMTDGDIGSQGVALQNLMEYATKYSKDQFDFYGIGIDKNIGRIFPKGGRVNPKNLAESLLEIISK